MVATIDNIGLFLKSRLQNHRNRKRSSSSQKSDHDGINDQASVALFTTLTLIGIMMSMLLLLAGVSMRYEGWTFFEGCYFGFITLSTIGFGDLVPTTPRQGFHGTSHAHVALFIVMTALYITLGLSVVSSVLVSLSRVFEDKTDWEFVSLRNDDYDDEDDDHNGNSFDYDHFGASHNKYATVKEKCPNGSISAE